MVGLFKGDVNRPWWMKDSRPSIILPTWRALIFGKHNPATAPLISPALSLKSLISLRLGTLFLQPATHSHWTGRNDTVWRLKAPRSAGGGGRGGRDSWAMSSLNVLASLFITALTWIIQVQTIVDISLIDSTPTVILFCWAVLWIIWPDGSPAQIWHSFFSWFKLTTV